MLVAFLVGIIVGFLICIPVGPINIWAVNTQLRHNFKSAISIALGAATMDFVYFMIILSGLSLFNFPPELVKVLKVLGIFVLFGFGLKELLVKKVSFTMTAEEKKKIPKAHSYYLLGIIMYTTNPTLVASMTGVGSVIKSWNLFEPTLINNTMLSFGLSMGTITWFYTLLKTVDKHKHKIPEKFFLQISRICGSFIIISSFYVAFKVYKEFYL